MPDVKLRSCKTGSSDYFHCSGTQSRRNDFAVKKWRKQEQKYEGRVSWDALHGEGVYEWYTGKERFVFEGQFYSNSKEGYGLISFPDGSSFEGLFCNNRPFGPGIYSYMNGRQDVGFWCGERLVRLSRPVDFIIPRLASTTAGKLKLLQFHSIVPFKEEADVAATLLIKHGLDPSQSDRLYSNLIHDPRSLFFNRPQLDKVAFRKVDLMDSNSESSQDVKEIPVSETPFLSADNGIFPNNCQSYLRMVASSDCEAVLEEKNYEPAIGLLRFYAINRTLNGCPGDLPRKTEEEEEEENKEVENLVDNDEEIESGETGLLSWNKNELCMEMLQQIFRFRSLEEKLTFKISDLMAGTRTKFHKTGERERVALHFLKMCSIGPAHIIRDLLCSENISEAIMDARGNNSIMFAVATDQHEVIDLLLNYGVDVNSYNDENLTPLNFCLLRRISETASAGNWEISFLRPDLSAFATEMKACETGESFTSLDRIFGDGMSAENSKVFQDLNCSDTDSVVCFDGEVSQDSSDITLLKYKRSIEETATFPTQDSPSRLPGNAENTLELGKGMYPKSFKREEYLRSVAQPTEQDKYLFELNPENYENDSVNSDSDLPVKEESKPFADNGSVEVNERICNVDKTIEQLLRRGADPNVGEVPKPSLHLAVHSKELHLLRLLLDYGASPDSQTLPQEGSLTPLHVIVLMNPGPVQVAMCELLLNRGASPQKETAPDFSPYKEGDFLFDPEHGRTPLQLLCTRPDPKSSHSKWFLEQLALLLVRVSKKDHFFCGHSYLTLAMIFGNYTLVKVLLKSKMIDPNQLLREDLGTALHVLVSAELQKRTRYEDSIQMCDLLLKHGANPNLKLRRPNLLKGTCIDYGCREVERERNKEEKGNYLEIPKSDSSNYLQVHLRVVEYLTERAKEGNRGEIKLPERWIDDRDDYNANGRMKIDRRGNVNKSGEKELYNSRIGRSETANKMSRKEGEVCERRLEEVARDAEISGGGTGEAVGKETGDTGGVRAETAKKRSMEAPGRRKGEKSYNHDKTRNVDSNMIGMKFLRKEKTRKLVGGSESGKNKKKNKGQMKKKEWVGNSRQDMSYVNSLNEKRKVRVTRESESLSQKFHHSLLHMFGICWECVDLSNFLFPYVVLRNGDLYYRYEGKNAEKTEQYSLI